LLLLLGGSDLLAGDLDGMWLRVDTGRARGVEEMESRTKRGGVGGVGAGVDLSLSLRDSSSTGASCG
jgi:hypothetical protein